MLAHVNRSRTSWQKAEGAVLASDAFFPMRDSADLAADYNIAAIVQPGRFNKRPREY